MQKNKYKALLKLTLIFIFCVIQVSVLGQENVQLRTDRDIYIAGEPMWISADCHIYSSSDSSQLSKIVYVELINKEQIPNFQIKIELNNGSGSTYITIPDTLNTENYTLRAYTKWMRNYNNDFFFQKTISIINPFNSHPYPKKTVAYQNDTLIFYPEADSILLNQENKINILALDQLGNPKIVNGYILSPLKDTLKHITTSSNGIFSLTFNPDTIGSYQFTYKTGDKATVLNLPKVYKTGTNIVLTSDKENYMSFVINNNNPILAQQKGQLHITSAKGDFIKKYPVVIQNNNDISIDKRDLPKGFLCARLINNKGELISSRYFSIYSPTKKKLKVTLNENTYTFREKVSASITNSNNLTNLSFSVVKKSLLNQHKTPFSGHPNNYSLKLLYSFISDSTSLNDLLACFTPYKQIFDSQPIIKFFPEMEGEIITGSFINTTTQEPIKNEVWIASTVDTIAQIEIIESDSLGRFKYVSRHSGTKDLVIQPFANNNHTNYSINIDPAFCSIRNAIYTSPIFLNKSKVEDINSVIKNMQIDLAYKESNLYTTQLLPEPTKTSFHTEPTQTKKIKKYIDLCSTEEVMYELIPHVKVRHKKDNYTLVVNEEPSQYSSDGETFSLVDGVLINEARRILNIKPEELNRVDVINLNYYYHGYNLGRIIDICTRKGDLSALDFNPDIFRQHYHFSQVSATFINPNYSADSIKNSTIPDFRNVLYWNPVLSDETGLSFYTSDESATYCIVVKGINQHGLMEEAMVEFEVHR